MQEFLESPHLPNGTRSPAPPAPRLAASHPKARPVKYDPPTLIAAIQPRQAQSHRIDRRPASAAACQHSRAHPPPLNLDEAEAVAPAAANSPCQRVRHVATQK